MIDVPVPELTYEEYMRQRDKILKSIRGAQAAYNTATDPSYKPMVTDYAAVIADHIFQLHADLEALVEQRNQQLKVERTS
jgi:hypothetical protein